MCNVWRCGTNSLTANCPDSSSPCLHITANQMKWKPEVPFAPFIPHAYRLCAQCFKTPYSGSITRISNTRYGKSAPKLLVHFLWLAHILMSALRWSVMYASVTHNNYGMFIIFDLHIRRMLLVFKNYTIKIGLAFSLTSQRYYFFRPSL